MTETESREIKAACLQEMRAALAGYSTMLGMIDERLWEYALDIVREDTDIHNIDEVLALRKFLRLLVTYEFNTEKVQRVFKAYEMLRFSGLKGRQQYRLTPVQVFMLASVFGPQREGKRLVRDAMYFIPRKFCKTTMGAFFQFWFFYFEDANSEGYCVANSQDQSKILYRLAHDLIHQLDPDEARIRFTASEINWRKGQAREAKVAALSAGGKAKDGMFAQLVTADEYGSAGYVKDHSDMANLLQVMRGSMGPRREPLTLITTTAGRVHEGPFELRLRQQQAELLREMDIPLGEKREADSDWTFLMALHPDLWEMDDESLQEPRVWQKVNPHIGITVQPDYYRTEWQAMLLDEETRKEQVTKLFNVFQSSSTVEWINGDDIRRLQIDRRIDDCTDDEGWTVFCGLDFSMGNDLHAASYLAVRFDDDGNAEFFADMDAWINEEAYTSATLRDLYRLWIDGGHLHLSEGRTLDPNLPVQRIAELYNAGVRFGFFGYDSHKATTPINALSDWFYMVTGGGNPKDYITPVSQTNGSYNPVVEEMDYMVKAAEPLIHFSNNPMWVWEFNNCVLDIDPRMENKKPLKRSQNEKVDNVQALLSALMMYDRAQGKEYK